MDCVVQKMERGLEGGCNRTALGEPGEADVLPDRERGWRADGERWAGGGPGSIFRLLWLLAVQLFWQHESSFLKANFPSQYILCLVFCRVFIESDYYFIKTL